MSKLDNPTIKNRQLTRYLPEYFENNRNFVHTALAIFNKTGLNMSRALVIARSTKPFDMVSLTR